RGRSQGGGAAICPIRRPAGAGFAMRLHDCARPRPGGARDRRGFCERIAGGFYPESPVLRCLRPCGEFAERSRTTAAREWNSYTNGCRAPDRIVSTRAWQRRVAIRRNARDLAL